MPTVTLTKRSVKNKTGIDINVPSYEPANSPRNIKIYHVVVISNLPHFKLPEHKENDVIQFMIKKDYDSFEKLQKQLTDQFPELKLPSLPRKHTWLLSADDIEDRKVSFDCLMTIVSRNSDICTSPPVLEFLGINLLADQEYFKRRKEYTSKQAQAKQDRGSLSKFEVADNEDIFIISSIVEEKPDTINRLGDLESQDQSQISSEGTVNVKAKLSLLGDETELNLPTDGAEVLSDDILDEDHSDLLNVSNALEDVLSNAQGSSTSSIKSKILLHDKSLCDQSSEIKDMSTMSSDDIMNYIQENKVPSEGDLELF